MNLIKFARKYGPHDVDYEGAELQPLNGDAGFRRYFRLTSSPTLMLVDSPPEKEKNLEYVRVSDFLANIGVRVPHIYAVSFEKGAFVNEDLGDALLLDQLNPEKAEDYYQKALAILLRMQTHEHRPGWIEDYSSELLCKEMNLFPDWFVEQLLGIEIDADTRNLINDAFKLLIENALEQPQVFVHKDFHSRNLMVLEDEGIATIDFQDAVWGPMAYDLVSLCKDCYVRWPGQKVTEVVGDYAGKLVEAGLLENDQVQEFPRMFDLVGLQRHIKVLGIFARLNLRDNKPRYLHDLPLVLRYTLEALAKYPEFEAFNQWMLEAVVPAAEQQPWYSDWQSAGNLLEF